MEQYRVRIEINLLYIGTVQLAEQLQKFIWRSSAVLAAKWKLRRTSRRQFHFFNQLHCRCSIVCNLSDIHMQIPLESRPPLENARNAMKNNAGIARTSFEALFTPSRRIRRSVSDGSFFAKAIPRARWEPSSLSTRQLQLAKCREHYSLHIVDVVDEYARLMIESLTGFRPE